jgi:hypothetical protein
MVGSMTAAVPYATTSVMKLDSCDASNRIDKMAFAPNPLALADAFVRPHALGR